MRNTIARAELSRQNQFHEGKKPRRRQIWRVIIAISLFSSLSIFAVELLGAIFGFELADFPQNAAIVVFVVLYLLPVYVLVPATTMIHVLLLYRTNAVAVNAIAREKSDNAWEMLILTGVNARQIVLGKWWATVRYVLRDYWLLAGLRVGLVIWLGLGITRTGYLLPPPLPFEVGRHQFDPNPVAILLSTASILLLTIASPFVTASFGLLSGLLSWRIGVFLGLGLRSIGIIFIGIGFMIISGQYISQYAPNSYDTQYWGTPEWITGSAIGIAGSGIITNGLTLSSLMVQDDFAQHGFFVFGFYGAILVLFTYVVLIWIVLQLAERVAIKQGATK